MKRYLIYSLFFVMLAVGVSGCKKGGSEATTAVQEETKLLPGGGTNNIYMLVEGKDSPLSLAALSKAGEIIEAQGYIVKAAYHQGDNKRQAELIGKAVKKKAAAIICFGADRNLLSGSIDEASKAGIPVFLAEWEEGGDEGAAATTIFHTEKGAEEAAGALLAHTANSGSFLFLSEREDTFAAVCKEGLQKLLDGTSVQLAASKAIKEDSKEAREAISAILKENKQINGIFCAGDEAAKAAVKAVSAAKRKDEIAIVSVGGSNAVRNRVKKQEILASYVLPAVKVGESVGNQVITYLSGGKNYDTGTVAEGFLMTADNAKDVDNFQLKK